MPKTPRARPPEGLRSERGFGASYVTLPTDGHTSPTTLPMTTTTRTGPERRRLRSARCLQNTHFFQTRKHRRAGPPGVIASAHMGSVLPTHERPGRRCERHDLAAGPDGWCALCRRERRESLPPARSRWSTRLLLGALGGVLVLCGVLLAYRATRAIATAVQPESPARDGSATAAAPAVPTAEPVAAQAPLPHSIGESVPLERPLPAPAAPAFTEAPLAPVSPSTPAPKASTPPARPTQAELQAALRATPIVMYATSWCGACRQARQFFGENGLSYREIDADSTPGGWDEVKRLTGRAAVPVIVVDGVVSQGLSPSKVMNAVAKSMERRLGITGVNFRPAQKKG